MKLKYKELEIETAFEGSIGVEDFSLSQELNSHAFLSVKLLVKEETAEQSAGMADTFPVTVREMARTKGKVIFHGEAECVYTTKENGLSYLFFEAYSRTKEWERIEKSRSFLDGSLTYMDVASRVLSDYGSACVKDEITGGARIPGMLLQYEESDWVFLRRLASHFGTFLMADAAGEGGRAYFGIPHLSYGIKLSCRDYTLEKNLFHYNRVLLAQGILPQEASGWKVKTRRYLFMGEEVELNGVAAIVTRQEIVQEKGELIYRSTLLRRKGIRREKEKNPRIYGMSIPATVKERSGNRVRVQFDIDRRYDPKGKFFTFAIESSSFYCMPEPESRVHIYFPDHDEQGAVAVHAIGNGGSAGGAGKNPDHKCFSDPGGSAMNMTPDSLSYSPGPGPVGMNLNNSGRVSLTGNDVTIKAGKGLTADAQKTALSGANKVVLQIGDGGEDMISLEEGTNVISALVEHSAELKEPAQPTADEIKSSIAEAQGGSDEEMISRNNEALTQQLVANKQASKQKFLNGVISIATVVGAVALTVATGGAAAPVLAAAVPKAVFAVADIAEGMDGYSKVNALDGSRPANFVRDTLFGGNEELYNIASTGADIFFDVVTGKGLMGGSQNTEMLGKICFKSQAANMAFQMGGSMVFGALNEYLTTGSFNLKNLGFYSLAGMVKGMGGNYLTSKFQGMAGSGNRWINKGIGFVTNTVFGFGVDVATNLALGNDFDWKTILAQNMLTSAAGQLFGEPIDAATGAFLITATDFVLPDIREELRFTRKYNSVCRAEGMFGRGWKFAYEGKLSQNGDKIHADLDSGYHVVFRWDGENARNITPGVGWYSLMQDGEEWLLADHKGHRSYRYGAGGFLQTITDRNGLSVQFGYREGNLSRIVTATGCTLSVTMREGRISRLADDLGRTMQYRYEDGLLTDVTHMDQGVTHYEYDGRGYLKRAVDQAETAYLENVYDAEGRVILQTLADGSIYRATYRDEKREVEVYSSVGDKTTVYRYGKQAEIRSVRYADGTKSSYEYDAGGYRIRETDRLGRVRQWQYDGTGHVTEERSPGGLVTSYRYSDAGDLCETSDTAGRLTRYEYDRNHNLTALCRRLGTKGEEACFSYRYDRMGRITGATDAEGNETVYRYEGLCGRPSAVCHPDGGEVRFSYDACGRLMSAEDACGRTEFGYNAKNKRTMVRDGEGNETHWMYDGMGRLLALYPPEAWRAQKGEYTFRYDFLDRETDAVDPDGGHHRRMRDGEGNILKEVHPEAYDADADDGEGVRYDYDSDGNRIRIHHPDGGCERLFYDAVGNRIRHVFPESYDAAEDDGNGWQYAYDEEDRLVSVTGPDGVRQALYAYDAAGNLVRETDAQGRTTYCFYTLSGMLCERLSPAAERDGEIFYQRTTYGYDRNGNRTREQRHGGFWTADGKSAGDGEPGLVLSFDYDGRGRLVCVRDDAGACIRWRYDVQGKRIYEEKAISEEIRQVMHYRYDRAGRLTEIREELDDGLSGEEKKEPCAVTRFFYDGNGRRTQVVTPEGYHVYREYDSCGRLAAERTTDRGCGIDRSVRIRYDAAGNITRITRQGRGQESWDVAYDYDLKDRIVRAADCLGPVFRYGYDKNDRLREEVLQEEVLAEEFCTAAGTVETAAQPEAAGSSSLAECPVRALYSYDLYGRLLTVTDGSGIRQEEYRYLPGGETASVRRADGEELEYSYGANGLLSAVRTAKSRAEGKAAQQYRYDARGRITGIRNACGDETGYDVDGWGRVCGISNADGGKEGYTYDHAGHITATTDAEGGTIRYRYNSRGKVCEITDQEGNRETFRYDREGRMTLHTDREGNRIKTVYNVDGRPVLQTACDRDGRNTVTRMWEYDAMGNVRKAEAGGFCYTYEYRPDGKLMKKSSSGKTLVSCTWHRDGNLASLTDVSGKTVRYSYDRAGRLCGIRDGEGKEIVHYTHTPGGKVKEILHGNGVRAAYEYDSDGKIIRLRLERRNGETISDFRYAYDLNGNRILKEGSLLAPEGGGTYGLRESRTAYRYDSMGRLAEECHDGTAVQYLYDRNGNRLERIEAAAGSGGKKGIEKREFYYYNKKNQMVRRESGGAAVTYHYDLQGNVLEAVGAEGITRYTYNAYGQQTQVRTSSGHVLKNEYDAEYLRAGTKEDGRQAQYVYFRGELLTEESAGEAPVLYIPGYGTAAGIRSGEEGYRAYLLDEQNSTAYILDGRQEIRNSYRYDAFGNIRGREETVKNRILYTGQQYDETTGQYYLRARFYEPAAGRFLQEDVYRGDGLNLYAYCAGNPVMYYDPSGFAVKDPEAVDLGDGRYEYPASGIRNEKGQFAGASENKPGDLSVQIAKDYIQTGVDDGSLIFGGTEVSVDTPLGERRYDLGYTRTSDGKKIGIEVKGDTARRNQSQRAKDSLLTENGGYQTTPRSTHEMDRVDEVYVVHVDTKTGQVDILDGEVSKYDTEGNRKKNKKKENGSCPEK